MSDRHAFNYYISKTKVHDQLQVKNTHMTCTHIIYQQMHKYFAHNSVLCLHRICLPTPQKVSPNCMPSLKRARSSCAKATGYFIIDFDCITFSRTIILLYSFYCEVKLKKIIIIYNRLDVEVSYIFLKT